MGSVFPRDNDIRSEVKKKKVRGLKAWRNLMLLRQKNKNYNTLRKKQQHTFKDAFRLKVVMP